MGVWGKGEGTFTKVPSPFPRASAPPYNLAGWVITPVMAVAAATAGLAR